MAASAIVAVGDDMYKTVCEKFVEASKSVLVANPLDPKVADEPMVMGPVISARSKKFILGMIETGIREGATLALDGRDIVVPGCEKRLLHRPDRIYGCKAGNEDSQYRDIRPR